MTVEFEEKRGDARYPFRSLVAYQHRSLYRFDYSLDISTSGMFIRTLDPLRKGTELSFQFCLLPESTPVPIKGKVVWVQRLGNRKEEWRVPGFGIQFCSLEEDEYDFIASVLETVKEQGIKG